MSNKAKQTIALSGMLFYRYSSILQIEFDTSRGSRFRAGSIRVCPKIELGERNYAFLTIWLLFNDVTHEYLCSIDN